MFNNKNHPHLELSQNQVILILMCIILLAFGFAISLMFKKYSYVPTDTTSKVMTTEERKQSIIQRLNTVSTKPLTEEERVEAVRFISKGGAT